MWPALLAAARVWGTKFLQKQAVRYARIYGKRFVAAAGRATSAAESRLANWAVGNRPITISSGKYYSPWRSKTAVGRFAQDVTWRTLYPNTKKSAFFSGFTQGTLRTTTSFSINVFTDIALGIPKALVRYPQYVKFVQTFTKTLQTGTKASGMRFGTLNQFRKAFQTAHKQSLRTSRIIKNMPKFDHLSDIAQERKLREVQLLARWERAGAITGRLGTASGLYFNPLDKEERDKRREKFRRTFTKQEVVNQTGKVVRTWVDGHYRNGNYVKGHWRSYA